MCRSLVRFQDLKTALRDPVYQNRITKYLNLIDLTRHRLSCPRVPRRGGPVVRLLGLYSVFALGVSGLLSLVVVTVDTLPSHLLQKHPYLRPAVGDRCSTALTMPREGPCQGLLALSYLKIY